MKNIVSALLGVFVLSRISSADSKIKKNNSAKKPELIYAELSPALNASGEDLVWDLSSEAVWQTNKELQVKYSFVYQNSEFCCHVQAELLRERLARYNLFATVSEAISLVSIQTDWGNCVKQGSFTASYGSRERCCYHKLNLKW